MKLNQEAKASIVCLELNYGWLLKFKKHSKMVKKLSTLQKLIFGLLGFWFISYAQKDFHLKKKT